MFSRPWILLLRSDQIFNEVKITTNKIPKQLFYFQQLRIKSNNKIFQEHSINFHLYGLKKLISFTKFQLNYQNVRSQVLKLNTFAPLLFLILISLLSWKFGSINSTNPYLLLNSTSLTTQFFTVIDLHSTAQII